MTIKNNEIEFLDINAVVDLILLSKSSLYRLMADGSFPRPVKIGQNRAVWIKSEIIAYRNKRIAMRDQVARGV